MISDRLSANEFDGCSKGFTLIELAISMFIIVMLLAYILPVSSTFIDNQNRAATLAKMHNIEAALNNFVIVNKRMPCPADGTAAFALLNPALVGTEGNCGASPQQAYGVVPWVALGLAYSDTLDSWNKQFSFRVGYGLNAAGALDMSSCDPAGLADVTPAWAGLQTNTGACISACAGATCTSAQKFLVGKGLNISNGVVLIQDQSRSSGAAYVLISHGHNSYGALTGDGTYLATGVAGVDGTTLESFNLATVAVTNAIPATTFVDAKFYDATDQTAYFDDIVIHPSVISVVERANLGPRIRN